MGGLPEALLVRHDREHASDLEEVAEATFHRAGKLLVPRAHAVTSNYLSGSLPNVFG